MTQMLMSEPKNLKNHSDYSTEIHGRPINFKKKEPKKILAKLAKSMLLSIILANKTF
jgi:hypothetical protein